MIKKPKQHFLSVSIFQDRNKQKKVTKNQRKKQRKKEKRKKNERKKIYKKREKKTKTLEMKIQRIKDRKWIC